MTNKDIKNTLCNINCENIAFNLWGLFGGDFFQLSKANIKEIKNHFEEIKTQEEKELIKQKINQWCEIYRCHSLIIK